MIRKYGKDGQQRFPEIYEISTIIHSLRLSKLEEETYNVQLQKANENLFA